MKLTIKNLQYGDFGNYRCISKNSLGETEGSIRVYGKSYRNFTVDECFLYIIILSFFIYPFLLRLLQLKQNFPHQCSSFSFSSISIQYYALIVDALISYSLMIPLYLTFLFFSSSAYVFALPQFLNQFFVVALHIVMFSSFTMLYQCISKKTAQNHMTCEM